MAIDGQIRDQKLWTQGEGRGSAAKEKVLNMELEYNVICHVIISGCSDNNLSSGIIQTT